MQQQHQLQQHIQQPQQQHHPQQPVSSGGY